MAKGSNGQASRATDNGGLHSAATVIGGLAIAVAFGMSALLSYGSLPGMHAPGCGPEAGCGKLADSDLGTLFGLWSSAFLGMSYFAAIGTAWVFIGGRSLPGVLAWLIRAGFVGSLVYVAVMVESGELCVYCLWSHVANLVLLVAVEIRRRTANAETSSEPQRVVPFLPIKAPGNAWTVGLLSAFLSTAVALSVTDGLLASQVAEEQEQAMDEDVEALLSGGGTGNRERPTPVTNTDEDAEQIADAERGEAAENGAEQNVFTLSESARLRILDRVNLPDRRVTGADRPGFTGRYLMGPEQARARIVMFSNPLCGSCRKVHKEVAALVSRRNDVSLSIKQFPLESLCNPMLPPGRRGFAGACAVSFITEAAGLIAGPEGYWAMTEWLYNTVEANNGSIDISQVNAFATQLGIDPVQLRTLSESDRVSAMVKADIDEGIAAGMTRTPFVVVNGQVVRSWTRQGDLTRTIERFLANPGVAAADSSGDTVPGATQNLMGIWRDHPETQLGEAAEGMTIGRTDDPAAVRIALWGEYGNDDTRSIDQLIRARLGGAVPITYEYRFFPLNEQCNSNVRLTAVAQGCDMARSVLAAHSLGGFEAGREMHDRMIALDRQTLNRSVFESIFTELGIDPADGMSAMASAETDAAIRSDTTRHTTMGINAIPVLMIDGKRVQWRNLEELDGLLDLIIAEAAR